MFLYIETKTGQTSSFILPVIEHELKTALIGKCPKERDRQGPEKKRKRKKPERMKHLKVALNRGFPSEY